MTTGELDFDDNFVDRDVYYPYLYGFWIVFVVLMPVLFNNLLVSYNGGQMIQSEVYFITGWSGGWRYPRRVGKGNPHKTCIASLFASGINTALLMPYCRFI